MNYELFFWRLSGSALYKELIKVPGVNKKLARLYDDIFSSHARTKFSKFGGKFDVINNSTRLISEDSINTQFYHKYYKPPKDIVDLNSQADENISYSDFYNRIVLDNNITNRTASEVSGTNKISLLTGTIGDGKTTLMSKLIYDIDKNQEKVIPIYISIEEEWYETDQDGTKRPKRIDGTFYREILFKKIKLTLENDPRIPDYLGKNFEGLEIESAISELVKFVYQLNFSMVFIFDDLDRYHFYYDKYYLFDNENQYQSLDDIKNLFNKFSKPDKSMPLAYLGVSVVFVLRDYVYSTIRENYGLNSHGTSSTCYGIKKPNYKEVVNARLNLLADAIQALNKQTSFWKDVQLNIDNIKNIIASIRQDLNSNDPKPTNLEKVFFLSHHGCRSIIDFMKGLKVFGVTGREDVIRRYLIEDHSVIVLLYMLNHMRLYTQDNNHFPNLFLINAHVISNKKTRELYPKAFEKHRHTYWLKYLILLYIKNQGEEGCTIRKLMAVFCEIGKYEPGIVKLVIGSLATPNWFSCIEIKYESITMEATSRKVVLTKRGLFLLSKDHHDQEFCFSFNYLQLIIDDYLLHFPNVVAIYSLNENNTYSYLYDSFKEYGSGFIRVVKDKYPKVINFVRVLECSFDAEMKRDEQLHQYLLDEGVNLPNFDSIYKSIESTVKSILGLKRALEFLGDPSEVVDKIRNNQEMVQFFYEAYLGKSPVIVESPETVEK